MAKPADKLAAVRGFLRSLNMVLKTVRLYGTGHSRSGEQITAAWLELSKALQADGSVNIAVAGNKMLVDGAAIQATPIEKSFAEMLDQGHIASVQFTSQITQDDFTRFLTAFGAAGAKLENLASELEKALGRGGSAGLRVNEMQFVEAGSGQGGVAGTGGGYASGIAAGSAGHGAAGVASIDVPPTALANAQRLLEMLGAQAPGAGAGKPTTALERPDLSAVDPEQVVRLLRQLAQTEFEGGRYAGDEHLRGRLASLPASVKRLLEWEVSGMAGSEEKDSPMLVQVAERMAIRTAVSRFASGKMTADEVGALLGRMSAEIGTLRDVVSQHEHALQRAGVRVESYSERLSKQFWAALPEAEKRRALLSEAAWSLPQRDVREFAEQQSKSGDGALVTAILMKYADGVAAPQTEVRARVAAGLEHLQPQFAAAIDGALERAIERLGEQLAVETDADVARGLGNVLVKFSQLALQQQRYDALKNVLVGLRLLVHRKPELATALRPRIGLETRVAELISSALDPELQCESLTEVLKELPRHTAMHLAQLFSQTNSRELCDRYAALARSLGPELADELSGILQSGSDAEALATVGLLARLEIGAVGECLAARLPRWNHFYQNLVVRHVAGSGAPDRGKLLVHLLDLLDPLVLPPAIDEIGATGDLSTAPRLIRIAQGEIPQRGSPYLIVKAIEALGRMHAIEALPALKKITEEKKLWRWVYPRELRIVALQAIARIEPAWSNKFAPESGLEAEELALMPIYPGSTSPGVRQRCYERVPVRKSIEVDAESGGASFEMTLKDVSLGGGLASTAKRLPAGAKVTLTIHAPVGKIQAVALLRGSRKDHLSFEIVDIEFEERSKLRRLLIELKKAAV